MKSDNSIILLLNRRCYEKKFAFLLIGIIVFIILTFTLQCVFKEQTKNFGISCGITFLSIFLLFEYKNALTPAKKGFGAPINMTKKFYEEKGKLHKYQNLCKILFIITIGFATLTLIGGINDVFFNYILSIF